MQRVVLETLLMGGVGDRLFLERTVEELTAGGDPLGAVAHRFSHAFVHSTSWRWVEGTVVLTFVALLADVDALEHSDEESSLISVADLEDQAIACHAVRHLHFLRFTDDEVAALDGFGAFWSLASAVADHHSPAVAGLLGRQGPMDGDFVI